MFKLFRGWMSKCGLDKGGVGPISGSDPSISLKRGYQLREGFSDRRSDQAQVDDKASQEIDHPSHYQGSSVEAIDVIEAFDLNFMLGNAIKYILRCDKKGEKIKDIEKAIWYLRREIEIEKLVHKSTWTRMWRRISKIFQRK